MHIRYVLVFKWYIYTYKFNVILKLPISHRDNRYLKYQSLTDIRYLTALTA
ncbi:hypothetical protein Hanom_Chr06g00533751 [Helianthus anomalus]